jgi:hypothetical protein
MKIHNHNRVWYQEALNRQNFYEWRASAEGQQEIAEYTDEVKALAARPLPEGGVYQLGFTF